MLPHVSVEVHRGRRLKEVCTTECRSHFIQHALFVKQVCYLSRLSFNFFANPMFTNKLGCLVTSYAVLCADCTSGIKILFASANIFII